MTNKNTPSQDEPLLFNNIDKNIKELATFYAIVGILGSIAGAVYFWISHIVLMGFIVLICGILASWIGSLLLYGFGELISKSSNIEEGIKKLQSLTACQNSNQNDKNNDIPDKVKATNADYNDNSIEKVSISNAPIRFKIANFQPSYNDKLIGKIMQIEHVINADISSDGIISCYYDDTIRTPSDILSLKELIKLQIAK